MDIAQLAETIEASAFGVWMRAGWSYPLANVAHLFGLALVLGPIALLDLRVLGNARDLPLVRVSRLLMRFVVPGLVVATLSGIALFAADATALIGNRVLWLKLGLISLALINALAFRRLFTMAEEPIGPGARVSAMLSIALWCATLVSGRLIAYV